MSTSAETKKALSESLKNLCAIKPYNNISVSEITEKCNLNRQSFYYHFKDKDQLLYWTYENSDFGIIISNYNQNTNKHIIYSLKTMEDERNFYVNTLKSNIKIFQKFLFCKINHVFMENLSLFDIHNLLSQEQREFLSGYYSFGLCGIIIKWAADGMTESAEKIAECINCLDLKSIFEVYLKNHLHN